MSEQIATDPQAQEGQEQQAAPRILSTAEIQQKLEENAMLIQAINERQSIGSLKECVQYQQRLQQNLMELAALADAQAAPQAPGGS